MDRFERDGLRALAQAQRSLLTAYATCLLALVLLGAAGPKDPVLAPLALRGTLGLCGLVLALLSWNLARELGLRAGAVACGVLTLVPLLGFVVLAVLNRKATRRLRQAGLRVGLLGARPRDVA